MAIALSVPSASAMQAVPVVPLCSAGRWVTHGEWPGWRNECADPGEVCIDPPYLLCLWHAGDLAARAAAS